MDYFSDKYNKWFRCEESNKHPRSNKLFKFGNYYFRHDKDIMIHIDSVDKYIDDNLMKYKRYRKESYCKKNNIDLT